jgi:hypothetical protein
LPLRQFRKAANVVVSATLGRQSALAVQFALL